MEKYKMLDKALHRKILGCFVFLGCFIVGISFFGQYHYIFDLFSHFYLQYFGLGVLVFCASIFLRSKLQIISSFVLLFFLLFQIFPVLSTKREFLSDVDIYYVNANYYYDEYDGLIDDLQKHQPKYIMIVELNQQLEELIENTIKTENNYVFHNGVSSYGLFTNEDIINYKNINFEYPVGEFSLDEGKVLLVHPFPPINSYLAEKQKTHFATIREYYDTFSEENRFILGDFNSSHYSPVFQKYFGDLEYQTIYSWNRGKIYSIPIDYILGNTDFFRVTTNDSDYSDHSPLLIDL